MLIRLCENAKISNNCKNELVSLVDQLIKDGTKEFYTSGGGEINSTCSKILKSLTKDKKGIESSTFSIYTYTGWDLIIKDATLASYKGYQDLGFVSAYRVGQIYACIEMIDYCDIAIFCLEKSKCESDNTFFLLNYALKNNKKIFKLSNF